MIKAENSINNQMKIFFLREFNLSPTEDYNPGDLLDIKDTVTYIFKTKNHISK